MAKNDNLTDFLTDLANTIRTKKGTSSPINPQDFSSEIASIGEESGDEQLFKGLIERTLSNIVIPSGTTEIGKSVFRDYTTLTSVRIPSSVRSILSSAFYGCNGLESLIIDEGVTLIKDSTFTNCTKLTSVVIPNSVATIESGVFHNCSNLTDITIGSGVTSMGMNTLNIGSTTNKATIKMLPSNPPSIYSGTMTPTKIEKIIVPKGCLSVYQSATNWSAYASYMEEAE